ncbi:MAG: ABC transporter ATP-binding protein [Chloroflexota bacterium]|nr:ABC transporter ATP-binding protein [Chloroflexota bacterium]
MTAVDDAGGRSEGLPAGSAIAPGGQATQAERGAEVVVDHVTVAYAADRYAVRDVSLVVRPGETVAIVGPSGCGKSTLLRAIAGLISPSSGKVQISMGSRVSKRIGFVFQADALLPWRTAFENVELAVRLAGEDGRTASDRAASLMAELGLAGSADRYPAQLSGGMRKRVSLARALAHDPGLFLMDEPLSALDAHTRIQVGNFLLSMLERFHQTCLFVTHDIDEAVAIGDRVLILSPGPGRIVGTCEDRLPRPRDYFESRFEPGFKDLQQQVWTLLRVA